MSELITCKDLTKRFGNHTALDHLNLSLDSGKIIGLLGPNGAGKTTASYAVLPEMLGCKEFVNADEIAKGLSPFNPESVAIEAGRLMLQRMDDLLSEGSDFAFETTLSTRSYVKFIERAQAKGYFVTLLYFWLPTPEQAIERVATRVREGGHNIPSDVIRRRYANGIKNLTALYIPLCNYWAIYGRRTDQNHRIGRKRHNNPYRRYVIL